MVELRNREREYAGSKTGAPKSFFQLKKRLPAPGNWRNMPFTGTVTGHDNWPISGRFWPVAWGSSYRKLKLKEGKFIRKTTAAKYFVNFFRIIKNLRTLFLTLKKILFLRHLHRVEVHFVTCCLVK